MSQARARNDTSFLSSAEGIIHRRIIIATATDKYWTSSVPYKQLRACNITHRQLRIPQDSVVVLNNHNLLYCETINAEKCYKYKKNNHFLPLLAEEQALEIKLRIDMGCMFVSMVR